MRSPELELPDDVDALNAMILAMDAQRAQVETQNAELERGTTVGVAGRVGLDAYARAANPAAASTCLKIKVFAASEREAWQNRDCE